TKCYKFLRFLSEFLLTLSPFQKNIKKNKYKLFKKEVITMNNQIDLLDLLELALIRRNVVSLENILKGFLII
ncbi:MAG: hypothetical protein PWK00_00875, partial [Coxiella burnetii]|nr:hypothetical protein [Coxiella burnetii]